MADIPPDDSGGQMPSTLWTPESPAPTKRTCQNPSCHKTVDTTIEEMKLRVGRNHGEKARLLCLKCDKYYEEKLARIQANAMLNTRARADNLGVFTNLL